MDVQVQVGGEVRSYSRQPALPDHNFTAAAFQRVAHEQFTWRNSPCVTTLERA